MTGNYRLIDHTADFGIEVFGADESALFEEAARAMFELMVQPSDSQGSKFHDIEVTGEDWPDLMINWLRELLYLFNGNMQVLCGVDIVAIQETRLSARISSEDFHLRRHGIKCEIKAVTYHQITVEPSADGWRALVIFDI